MNEDGRVSHGGGGGGSGGKSLGGLVGVSSDWVMRDWATFFGARKEGRRQGNCVD